MYRGDNVFVINCTGKLCISLPSHHLRGAVRLKMCVWKCRCVYWLCVVCNVFWAACFILLYLAMLLLQEQ